MSAIQGFALQLLALSERDVVLLYAALALGENRSLAFRRPEQTHGAAVTTDDAAAAAHKGIVGLEDLSLAMEKVCSKSDELYFYVRGYSLPPLSLPALLVDAPRFPSKSNAAGSGLCHQLHHHPKYGCPASLSREKPSNDATKNRTTFDNVMGSGQAQTSFDRTGAGTRDVFFFIGWLIGGVALLLSLA